MLRFLPQPSVFGTRLICCHMHQSVQALHITNSLTRRGVSLMCSAANVCLSLDTLRDSGHRGSAAGQFRTLGLFCSSADYCLPIR